MGLPYIVVFCPVELHTDHIKTKELEEHLLKQNPYETFKYSAEDHPNKKESKNENRESN